MYVKGFKIGFDNSKKLWLIMLGAVSVAILLIVIAFTSIYSNLNSNISVKSFDIKQIENYKISYTLNVKSNKNQNYYKMEEEHKKSQDKEFFEFKIYNGDEIITYTFENDTLSIKSNVQKLEYVLNEYMLKKENIISISTFLELYRNIDINKNDNFSISITEFDNKISYSINVDIKNKDLEEYKFLDNISKLEVIVNKENKKINEYIVYDDKGNAYIDIIYDNFVIHN